MNNCKWCGKGFIKKHNRQVYCSKYCSEEGEKENSRNRRMKHYHKYKHVTNEEKKYGLGSGFLSMHRHEEYIAESIAVQKEMKRLNIKKTK